MRETTQNLGPTDVYQRLCMIQPLMPYSCRLCLCLHQDIKWPRQTFLVFFLFRHHRLLHVRNGNCKYHLGEETFKLAQSYMDKLAKHGHQANKAALYGELCALLFAKSHYDEVCMSY